MIFVKFFLGRFETKLTIRESYIGISYTQRIQIQNIFIIIYTV